jgi:hypothetical protein
MNTHLKTVKMTVRCSSFVRVLADHVPACRRATVTRFRSTHSRSGGTTSGTLSSRTRSRSIRSSSTTRRSRRHARTRPAGAVAASPAARARGVRTHKCENCSGRRAPYPSCCVYCQCHEIRSLLAAGLTRLSAPFVGCRTASLLFNCAFHACSSGSSVHKCCRRMCVCTGD